MMCKIRFNRQKIQRLLWKIHPYKSNG
jgi:hypothetical protein